MRLTLKLLAAAAPLAIAAVTLAPAPAHADSTPQCNTGLGPDGIAGTPDDPAGSTECGINSKAAGLGSTAVGANSTASQYGTATGDQSTASGGASTATGDGSTASGAYSTATGEDSKASGDQSAASGYDSKASGVASTATGENSIASGQYSTASGGGSTASGDGSIASGGFSTASGSGSIANGYNSTATGKYSIATGLTAAAEGTSGIALGGGDSFAGSPAAVAYDDHDIAIGGASVAGVAGTDPSYAGQTDDIALGYGAQATGGNAVALGQGSIADVANTVSVGAAGSERRIVNVAAGTLGAASTDAVNGSQLYATNQQVTTNAANIATLQGQIAAGGGGGGSGLVQQAGPGQPVTVAAATGGTVVDVTGTDGARQVTGVADGSVAAGSTDAVNGSQLAATNQQVTTNTSAIAANTANIAGNTTAIAGNTAAITANTASIAANTSAIAANTANITTNTAAITTNTTNIADNTSAITSNTTSIAANTGAIATNATNIAANTTVISTLADGVANGSVGPVRYADSATPTTPNGGTTTNDLTLVGGASGAVGLHNVADGAIAAGSTDAVNGGQIYKLALTAANAVSYDTDAKGNRTNTLTLAGGTSAPVTIHNVAGGAVAAGSTDAVNGGQLNDTNQAVAAAQGTADHALTLGQNSVQYDDEDHSGVTLGDAEGAPVAVHNVAAGTADTDAVNVGQLNSGLDNAISQANAYTDSRLMAIDYDLRAVRRNANAGTASALAAAGLPQAYEPGKGMIALGGGTYQGQSAIAFGFSEAFSDEHTVVKLSASYDTRGKAGGSVGMGYQF